MSTRRPGGCGNDHPHGRDRHYAASHRVALTVRCQSNTVRYMATSKNTAKNSGIDVVISRTVLPERQDDFERWVERLRPAIAKYSGLVAFHVAQPKGSEQPEYVIVNQWESPEHLAAWERSDERGRLFAAADEISVEPARIQHLSGMQGVFTLPGTRLSVAPPKYKMWCVIFSGLFPLTLFWTMFAAPYLHALPVAAQIATIVAINVGLMVYLYLPAMTQLLRNWLSK